MGNFAHWFPRNPYRPTALDRVAGTGLLFLGAFPIVAERSTTALLPLVSMGLCVLALVEKQPFAPRFSWIAAILWTALGYAAVSSTWALDPTDTLTHVGAAMIMLGSVQILTRWIDLQKKERLRFLAFWMLVGFCIGLLYLSIELISMQGIKRLLVHTSLMPDPSNKMYTFDDEGNVSIMNFELNRNIAVANLLLWPALLSTYHLFKPPLRRLLMAVILVAIMTATFLSVHETSKIALPMTLLVFVVAYLRPKLALLVTLAGFSAIICAVVPLSKYAHQTLQLENSPILQFSAKQRIQIWGSIASHVADAPIFGVGVRSTYAMNSDQRATDKSVQSSPKMPTHAHNVYLQTWFELGALGALLLMMSGLALLYFVSKLPTETLPFALAALSMGYFEIASSWDIWQRWFFATLAVSALYTVLASRLASAVASESEANR
jgi:hypothetical protein